MIDLFKLGYSEEAAVRTSNILKSISSHLAKRKSCKGMTYRVAIGMYDCEQIICRKMWSNQNCSNSVFFDTNLKLTTHLGRRRCGSPVIQHIITEHFPEVYAGCANGNQVYYKHNMLVPGIYEYRLSASGKYRKWVRIK